MRRSWPTDHCRRSWDNRPAKRWIKASSSTTPSGGGHDAYPGARRSRSGGQRAAVYPVITSATTAANLRASGHATLVTIAATYTKLDAKSTREDGNWLIVTFTVKQDSISIPLRPPSYRVDEDIATNEDWARSATLLVTSRGRRGTPHGDRAESATTPKCQ